MGKMPECHCQVEPRTQLCTVLFSRSALCPDKVALETWTQLIKEDSTAEK